MQLLQLREVVRHHQRLARADAAIHVALVAGHRDAMNRLGEALDFHRHQHHRRPAKDDARVADHLHALDARHRGDLRRHLLRETSSSG